MLNLNSPVNMLNGWLLERRLFVAHLAAKVVKENEQILHGSSIGANRTGIGDNSDNTNNGESNSGDSNINNAKSPAEGTVTKDNAVANVITPDIQHKLQFQVTGLHIPLHGWDCNLQLIKIYTNECKVFSTKSRAPYLKLVPMRTST
jgi:hypothetical protein